MSATSLFSPSRYSSMRGKRHMRSPQVSPAAVRAWARASSVVMKPVAAGPRAICVARCQLLASGVADGVGQDQAALGVRVDHLDGLAVHGPQDVAGLGGGSGG